MTIKVLAIDDSRTIREMLRHTLSEGGFEVHVAEDGIDGLEKLPQVGPDVVITDINMPRMDGFGVIDSIRSMDRFSGLPILVLTTENAQDMKERARRSGATGWIVKAFDDAKLIGTIRRITVS